MYKKLYIKQNEKVRAMIQEEKSKRNKKNKKEIIEAKDSEWKCGKWLKSWREVIKGKNKVGDK